MLDLTTARRRELRAAAHSLHPVVAIGHHGLTVSVLHEIDVALLAHELVKVRVFDDDRTARESMLARICAEMQCAPVQHIGKLLVLWRPNPERKARAAKEPAAAPRGAAKPKAPGPRTQNAPTGKRAPAPRRRRIGAAGAPPPREPRSNQSRRRRAGRT